MKYSLVPRSFQWIVKDCQRVGRWCGKKKIGVTEGSGEWAYHQSEHMNVRVGLIITRFTFLWSLAETCIHMYYISFLLYFVCVTMSSQTARSDETWSVRIQHICFPDTVWLWPQWLVIRGVTRTGVHVESQQRLAACELWPNYPTNGLSLLGLHFIITEPQPPWWLVSTVTHKNVHAECRCTGPSDVKPIHQALSLFFCFWPLPITSSIIASSTICIWGPGDQASYEASPYCLYPCATWIV